MNELFPPRGTKVTCLEAMLVLDMLHMCADNIKSAGYEVSIVESLSRAMREVCKAQTRDDMRALGLSETSLDSLVGSSPVGSAR